MRAQRFPLFFRWLSRSALVAMLCAGCGEKTVETLPKYPVSGTVLVNGKPQAGVMVTLTPVGDTATGPNARGAAGVTDAEGNFELTTIVDADGAFPGEYTATFKWVEPNEFPPRDRFGGAFADAKTSKHQVTVEKTDNVLEPFELEFAGT